MELAVLIIGVVFVLLVALFTVKTVRIVPQARARKRQSITASPMTSPATPATRSPATCSPTSSRN